MTPQDKLQFEKQKALYAKAINRFVPKSFEERYSELASIANASRFVLPLLSIATGTAFLFSILNSAIPVMAVALSLALIFLSIWEAAKSKMIELTFEDYYTAVKLSAESKIKRKSSISLGVIAFLLVVIFFSSMSMFASVQGAKELHKQFDSSVKTWNAKRKSRKQALHDSLHNRIDSLKLSRKAYEDKVRWKGNVDMSNKATTLFLKNNTERLGEAEKELHDQLKQFEAQTMLELADVQEQHGFNLKTIIVLAVIVDGLIILCGWFCVFYDYKIGSESDILYANKSQEITFKNTEQLKTFFMSWLLHNPDETPIPTQPHQVITASGVSGSSSSGSTSIPQPQNVIGFGVGESKKNQEKTKKTVRSEASSEVSNDSDEVKVIRNEKVVYVDKSLHEKYSKYKDLEDAIKNGEKDNRTLAKYYKASIPEITRIKNKYGK